jgi:hypothetical protein
MRARCEGCGKPQPPDWKAGDLCSFCGQAVRHDVRCYWCAKWVPAAKFCRSCGAAVVDERLYGAARMLKDAGTDRFTIPKQLKEFDPDQIENFSRIYQRHAIAVARHVDELRFLERFLHQKHWSAELEDQLIPQLPWNEETLARMSAPPHPPGDDLATAKAIQEKTPFDRTESLAQLARLRLNDWSVHKEACGTFHSGDPAVRAEAALALTGWRVWATFGRLRDLERPIVQELQKSTFKVEAAVRLGLLGIEHKDLLRDALASADPELSFPAALVLGEVDRLQAALRGDGLQKIAAGNKLIALGIIKPVVETVEKSPLEVQRELVESLVRRKEPAPEAETTLLEIVETTEDESLRERAVRILCRRLRPEWVLRIARAAEGDRHIYQSLLQAPDLAPDAAQELGDFLLANKGFRTSQYGLSTVAENGRMPDTFVPSRFARADEETRGEMLRFAETQLERRGSEELHRFVLNVVFGAYPAKTRAAAWWVLHRWYRSKGEYRGEGPFKLEKGIIAETFGSVGAFLPKLAAVLRDRDTLKEVGYYEMMANVLNSADDVTIAAMQAEASGAQDLVLALIEGMRGDYWPNTVEGMIKLLSQVGGHPRWRDQALDALRALGKKGNYPYDKAVRRMELSAHGIPEELEWNKLALDFVPSRFPDADSTGRLELLKVVEHQLIHKKTDEPDAGLLRLLLETALRPSFGPAVRAQALEIHQERARHTDFPLKKKEVERAFGPLPDFLALLPDALRSVKTQADPHFLDFLAAVFSRPERSDLALLTADEKTGHALIGAILDVLDVGALGHRLGQNLVRFLEHVGAHDLWRAEVCSGLDRVSGDLKPDCERVLRQILPPEPDRPELDDAPRPERGPHRVHPVVAPPPVDYAEKGRIAQQMGFELQAAMAQLMAGPASPEEKMRVATRMSEEYQAKIKALYNT